MFYEDHPYDCVFLTSYSLVPNPLGLVAVLSAFNFPVAVYGWLARPFRTCKFPN